MIKFLIGLVLFIIALIVTFGVAYLAGLLVDLIFNEHSFMLIPADDMWERALNGCLFLLLLGLIVMLCIGMYTAGDAILNR